MGDLRGAASVVGVGMTRFGNVLETPEIKDQSLQDLMADAAFQAMDDAGVGPRDIDLCLFSHYQVPTTHVNVPYRIMDWIGMRFKKAISYNTACSTTNTGAGLAATLINGGMADRILVVSGEILNSGAKFDPTVREPLGPADVWEVTDYGGDQEYFYQHWYSVGILYGAAPIIAYAKKYQVPMDKMEDSLMSITRHLRRCSALNSKAYLQETLEDEAHDRGFKDMTDYWRSKYNPYMAYPVRAMNALTIADGATAYVVTRSDIARNYTDVPIDILGFDWRTFSMTDWYAGAGEDPANWPAVREAFRGAYRMAQVEASDIDYLHIHDCMHSEYFTTAEASGYFKRGEAWKAYSDNRIDFDGDKPVNCSGGRHGVGHAFAASGGADLYDTVKQMQGKAGKRQIKPEPEKVAWHNTGYGQHCSVTVLGRR
jgi:acetyl-CoA C-acetyltransferase